MKPSLPQRMDIWVRHLVPMGSSILLLLFTVTPSRIPDFSVIMPMIPVMCVYYWSIYRPDLVSAHGVFFLGLLYDCLGMFPIGLHALVFLLVHGVVLSSRRFLLEGSLMVMWSVFATIAAGVYFFLWIGTALLHGMAPIKAVFFSYIMTVALYPLINWGLARLQVALLRDA